MPWMKKILKDRIKLLAAVVEESLGQAAHMLSSSGWCLLEQGFYYFLSGSGMNLKWGTTTAGNGASSGREGLTQSYQQNQGCIGWNPLCWPWQWHRPFQRTHPQWSCKEREGMALPGAEISQLARQCCTVGALFPHAQWGQWPWPVMVTGSGAAHGPPDMSVLTWLGQGRKSQQAGAEHRLTSAQEWDCKYIISKEK